MLLVSSLGKIFSSCARNALRPRSLTRFMHSESGKCLVNDVELYYEKVGQGSKVLLCLPGAMGSTRTDFGPQLDQLKEKFTVVAFDPRGYGKSIPPKRDFPLDFYHRDADDAVGLMEQLGYSKYSVLGWSDGGIFGLILAGKYPSNVDRLVVWGCNASVTKEDLDLYEAIRDVSKWNPKMRQPLEDLYGDGVQGLWDGWIDSLTSIFNECEGNLCKELLPKIICPTLIIHGEKDPLVPSFHPQYIHKNLKGSILHLMPEGRHNLHLRFAEEFNKYVTDFCKE
ncbi:valacyclovir hydrolase-like [Dendronephthya gigantea]|uniref:valacyclovir hydrolase-like n=1 Tax=Dendronephthya gigantea TaxID=151771 RepID=UPI001069950C|nr:valacyclovir hydrolase-like [Dendronephthya gigantea]